LFFFSSFPSFVKKLKPLLAAEIPKSQYALAPAHLKPRHIMVISKHPWALEQNRSRSNSDKNDQPRCKNMMLIAYYGVCILANIPHNEECIIYR
jgi:hypothetical protein